MEETKEFKVGDEVKVIGNNYSFNKSYIGESGKVIEADFSRSCYPFEVLLDSGDSIEFSADELELVEPKEPVLTKAEALKAAIDGAKIMSADPNLSKYAKNIYVDFDGINFVWHNENDGTTGVAKILGYTKWKLWTPPTPKPKFSIGQTVIDDGGDSVVIKNVEFKDGRFEYEASYEMSVQYDESELSEVSQWTL